LETACENLVVFLRIKILYSYDGEFVIMNAFARVNKMVVIGRYGSKQTLLKCSANCAI